MRIVNVKECGEQEIERLLRKAAFDEVELSPAIREGNKKLFGADLTAADVCGRSQIAPTEHCTPAEGLLWTGSQQKPAPGSSGSGLLVLWLFYTLSAR